MTMAGGYGGSVPAVGTQVVTAAGDELSTIEEVSGTCVEIDAPMRPDYWLASDCIAGGSGDQVRLSVTKDNLDTAKVEGPAHTSVHRHGTAGPSSSAAAGR